MSSLIALTLLALLVVVVVVCCLLRGEDVGPVASRPVYPVESEESSLEEDTLSPQNTLRAEYGLPALTWDESLASTAQAYSEKLASRDSEKLVHSQTQGLGENLAWSTASVSHAVKFWIDEKSHISAGRCPFQECGHLTQILWKSTTHVGCGAATGASGRIYVTCNYSPQGNIIGQYQENSPFPFE